MKVAAAQIACALGDIDANVRKMRDFCARAKENGVEPEFPREARRLGYDFTPEELAQLRTHGVDSQYLRHLQDTGMRNLSADQIAQLRIHGVD